MPLLQNKGRNLSEEIEQKCIHNSSRKRKDFSKYESRHVHHHGSGSERTHRISSKDKYRLEENCKITSKVIKIAKKHDKGSTQNKRQHKDYPKEFQMELDVNDPDSISKDLPKSYIMFDCKSDVVSKYKIKRSNETDIVTTGNLGSKSLRAKESSKMLVWEEELYGPDKKKMKYDLLCNKSVKLIDSEIKSITTDYVTHIETSITGNDTSFLINDSEVVNLPEELRLSPNNFNVDLSADKENDFVNVHNADPPSIVRKVDYEESFTVPYIIIDYQHEDKHINNETIYKIIQENIHQFDYNGNYNISCQENGDEYLSKVSDEISSDLKILADLVVNAPLKEHNTAEAPLAHLVTSKVDGPDWKIIKITSPIREAFTKENIDLSRCHINDPRVAHLRST